MEDHFVIRLSQCNRCGCNSYEQLRSHGYCANCNYSPACDEAVESCVEIPDWALEAFKSPVAPESRQT